MRKPTADAALIKLVAERYLKDLPEPAATLEFAVDGFGPLDHETATLFGDDSPEERKARLKVAAEQARQSAGSPEKVARVMRLDEGSRLPERRAALSPGPVQLMQPRPTQVSADNEGSPLRIRGKQVEQQRERWVIEDAWWTPRPVRRRYFELVMEDGANAVIFQDLTSRRWYEQRA